MFLNTRSRGIGINKNASNIQQALKPTDQQQLSSADNQDNLKQQLQEALKPTNKQQANLNAVKRLTQLNLTKVNTIISDENAGQPVRLAEKQAKLASIEENEVCKPLATSQLNQLKSTIQQAQQATITKPLSTLNSKPSLIPLPTSITSSNSSSSNINTNININCEIEDIDKSTSRDAMYLVCDVAKDIYEYMYQLEIDQEIKDDPLKDQKIFTPKVRHRLVNWCIEIHQTLKLLPETLYMTISIIDRYFEQVQAKQQNVVQLVAVGATLIASKYEEIYPPDVGDLIHLTQNVYSRREIFRIEINILETLQFNLGKPIPPAFLRRFSKANQSDLKTHSMAKFLMELSLSEYECCHWKPSLLAAAALYVSIHLIHHDINPTGSITRRFGQTLTSNPIQHDRWNRTLVHYSHYNKRQLQEPAAILCKILKKSQKNPLTYTVVKKYQANLLKWNELKSTRVDQLIKAGSA